MNTIGMNQTLVDVLSEKDVYPDYVPEGVDLPAVAYTHVSNSGGRLVSGVRMGVTDTWRINVVAEDADQLKTFMDKVIGLDNSGNEYFQRIFVLTYRVIPTEPEDDLFYGFVDFRTYD